MRIEGPRHRSPRQGVDHSRRATGPAHHFGRQHQAPPLAAINHKIDQESDTTIHARRDLQSDRSGL